VNKKKKLLLRQHEEKTSGSTANMIVNKNDKLNLHTVAEACVGYVAADLSALVRRATMLRIEETLHIMRGGSEGGGDCSTTTTFTTTTSDSSNIDSSATCSLLLSPNYNITTNNLLSAMDDVGASCLRDATITAPPATRWEDIGGDAGGAKRALREAIEWPRLRQSAFLALGLSPPRGVLLFGPPGCGKTTLARAAAGASGVAFISLGPADVYSSSYVGDAEAVIRRAFDLARSAAPCVLFFDEIDAIIDTGNSSSSGNNDKGSHGMGRGSSAEARVLSTFLNEMDGIDGSTKDGVLVLGATNRPSVLDAALMRPGRFDRVVYVPQPDEVARRAILVMECTKWHNALFKYYSSTLNEEIGVIATDDVSSSNEETMAFDGVEKHFNFDVLASDDISGLMTGAEIVGACRETAIQVMRTIMMESHCTDDNDVPPKSKATAVRHIQTLMLTLKAALINTTPLLQSERVVKEYTTFGTNNCMI
jgi:SpoVK/Ycf46/Vps4 family AAA+-type ATPase